MTRRKLIEVALPLDAINEASAREKSIRHGHPSTLHLWFARRPLAACRAVIFASLVDDPDDPDAPPAFVNACRNLAQNLLPPGAPDTPRQRLFGFIAQLVRWESTTDQAVLEQARALIRLCTDGNPPPLLDPFAGGGSIPLEAQRLGLEAHASDLNPVPVIINKALIEIPPRFAGIPPVNPGERPLTPNPSPTLREERGEMQFTSDPSVALGGERGGIPLDPSVALREERGEAGERWHISVEMKARMTEIARLLRKNATPSEDVLWQALRNRRLDNRKFKRQIDIGPFVLDFYCPEERLAVEVDGSIHALQQDADKARQQLIESLGIRFVRISADLVETNLPLALKHIRDAFTPALPLTPNPSPTLREERGEMQFTSDPSAALGKTGYTAEQTSTSLASHSAEQQRSLPLGSHSDAGQLPPPPTPLSSRSVGEGQGVRGLWRGAAGLAADVRYYGDWMRERAWERIGHLYPKKDGETVIAWLWARTVKSPNPNVKAPVPLVRSWELSKKKGRHAWIEPVFTAESERIQYTVKTAQAASVAPGTVNRKGGKCLISGMAMPFEYIRAEGKAGRMGAQMIAIVTEGTGGRSYYAPEADHEAIAAQAVPTWKPDAHLEGKAAVSLPLYGMPTYGDLFTPRQLVALTTFSDLVAEARAQIQQDALAAGMAADDVPLREGGSGALAYAEAVSVYLGMIVSRLSNRMSTLCFWDTGGENIQQVFARQALPMVWDNVEGNPFSDSTGNFIGQLEYLVRVLEHSHTDTEGFVRQQDAMELQQNTQFMVSTDPPYFDMIGYGDLSDYFYIWLKRTISNVYPELFHTLLAPKEAELIAAPYRHNGNKEAARQFFENGLLKTFKRIRSTSIAANPMTVYYAFKQQDSDIRDISEGDTLSVDEETNLANTGWETMLSSLIDAGFSINGTYPMRTELTGNLKKNVNALASSIVLVCRPRAADAPIATRRQFLEALRRELPPALRDLQSGGIVPVDMAQAIIGPGMAIYSRYSAVRESSGERLSVRTALGLINQALDSYLSEQEGDLDAATRFAVAWFEQYGFNAGEYGVAEVLALAKNVSVDGVARANVLESARGKVRLLKPSELEPSWQPGSDERLTIWETVHHLIARLDTVGESGAAALMARLPGDVSDQVKDLAFRLYNICERKSWSAEGYAYNVLVQSLPQIKQLASEKLQQGKLDLKEE